MTGGEKREKLIRLRNTPFMVHCTNSLFSAFSERREDAVSINITMGGKKKTTKGRDLEKKGGKDVTVGQDDKKGENRVKQFKLTQNTS